jgi:hypothetical protein
MVVPSTATTVTKNIINLGADLGAMAAALNLLIGGPIGLYVVGFAIGCTWLEVYSRYERYVSAAGLRGGGAGG